MLCDKIAFLGNGGYLCFFGTYEDALTFFRTSSIVDIYTKLTEQPQFWSEKFSWTRLPPIQPVKPSDLEKKRYFSIWCPKLTIF